jgi:hypothetical protein
MTEGVEVMTEEQAAELDWLMANSDGVAGLRADGTVMPWDEVQRLYLPSLRGE